MVIEIFPENNLLPWLNYIDSIIGQWVLIWSQHDYPVQWRIREKIWNSNLTDGATTLSDESCRNQELSHTILFPRLRIFRKSSHITYLAYHRQNQMVVNISCKFFFAQINFKFVKANSECKILGHCIAESFFSKCSKKKLYILPMVKNQIFIKRYLQ